MKKAVIAARWLLAVGCAYWTVRSTMTAMKIEGFAAAPPLIMAFGSLILAVVLIAPETVVRICEFLSRPLTNIVYPNARAEKPPLSYRLAHLYTKQLRFAEAVEEYQKIIQYYPRERTAYLELLTLAKAIDHAKLYEKYAKLYTKQFKDVPFADERPPHQLKG